MPHRSGITFFERNLGLADHTDDGDFPTAMSSVRRVAALAFLTAFRADVLAYQSLSWNTRLAGRAVSRGSGGLCRDTVEASSVPVPDSWNPFYSPAPSPPVPSTPPAASSPPRAWRPAASPSTHSAAQRTNSANVLPFHGGSTAGGGGSIAPPRRGHANDVGDTAGDEPRALEHGQQPGHLPHHHHHLLPVGHDSLVRGEQGEELAAPPLACDDGAEVLNVGRVRAALDTVFCSDPAGCPLPDEHE